MFTKVNRPSWRDSIQQQGEVLDENWENVKVEATELMTELQETYDDILHAFKEVVDRRRARRQKPLVRFVRHYPWVPLMAGAGAVAALVIAARAR